MSASWQESVDVLKAVVIEALPPGIHEVTTDSCLKVEPLLI